MSIGKLDPTLFTTFNPGKDQIIRPTIFKTMEMHTIEMETRIISTNKWMKTIQIANNVNVFSIKAKIKDLFSFIVFYGRWKSLWGKPQKPNLIILLKLCEYWFELLETRFRQLMHVPESLFWRRWSDLDGFVSYYNGWFNFKMEIFPFLFCFIKLENEKRERKPEIKFIPKDNRFCIGFCLLPFANRIYFHFIEIIWSENLIDIFDP